MKRGKSKINLKNSKNVKIVFGIFALIILSAILVYAINTPASGYRVVKDGGYQDINAHEICRRVTNNYRSRDIFVPTNKSIEWTTFLFNRPSYVGLGGCVSCTPNCAGKICGPDGCGGSCGSCPVGKTCNSLGTACITSGCTPDCFGKDCGDDDGCGGKCTNCPFPQICNPSIYICELPEGKCLVDEDCGSGETCDTGTCVLTCFSYRDCPASTCEWELTEDLDLCTGYCEIYWYCDTYNRCRVSTDRVLSPKICRGSP